MISPLTNQVSFVRFTGQYDQSLAGRAIQNADIIRTVNGLGVDVSGSLASVQGGGGAVRAASRPAAPLLDGSTVMALGQLYTLPPGKVDRVETARAEAVGDAGLAIANLPAEPIQATYTPAPEPVEGVGFLPGDALQDPKARMDTYRQEIARAGALAQAEKSLSQQEGVPVHLAFDQIAQNYVMLKPGQLGYDDVPSAQSVFAKTPYDLYKMQLNPKDFADVFAQYGMTV